MCTADMATIVHSDICSLLNGETLVKTKKTRKITKISRKETSHEKWLEGYWKWRMTNKQT